MTSIWENGKYIAKIEEHNGWSFTCLKFSKKKLRFQEVQENIDKKSLTKNLKNWNMKKTGKIMVAV